MNYPFHIYLAEDDEDDAFLFQKAFRQIVFKSHIEVFSDGNELLQKMEDPENLPGFIFLDLRLPGMGGMEALGKLKIAEKSRLIPTFMYTTSECPENRREAYRLGANSYFIKPVLFSGLLQLVENFTAFWKLAQRPSRLNRAD
ncbi:response regulator [Larkinella soli]|uniref:response regulator n=1 Tax=Larkinella soli TaxID=1770527 RepID=UPI000FFB9558|nr:response regulator [Larkinella soli]